MSSYPVKPVSTSERGEGCHIWDTEGRRYLDALPGLFVVRAGHGREELAQAAGAGSQAGVSRCGPTPTPTAVELADRLAAAAMHRAPRYG